MADEAIHNHYNAEEQEVGAIQALEQRIERMERTLEWRFEQRLDQRFEELRTMLGALNLRADQNAVDDAEVPEEKRVKLVAYRLKGGASAWWDRVQESRGRVGKQPIQTWERMRRMLRARFIPPDYEQYLFMKYQRCVQGSRSVHDYTAEFLRLAECNALNESKSQQVARYMEGLKPTIRDKIGVQMVAMVDDARSLALKAEMMTHDRENSYRGNYAESSQTSAKRSQAIKRPKLNKQGQGNFDKSAGKKLVTETGASRNQNSLAKQFTVKCFKCNQPGHRLSDCPRRKAIALMEHEEDVEDVFCDPEEEEDEEYSGDDDYEQTYMLIKEGVRYTLVPLSEKPKPKTVPKVEGKAFLIETHSEREIEADFKESKELHVLIVKDLPSQKQIVEVLEEVSPYLLNLKRSSPMSC
ncbi:hypothetical protein CRG98_001420 [Punica granatum]|uniref:CCHC-type domain-containing protein n=1 Tax=Punica granatum TaxID=22663 RepID=A0A2I0LBY4_PUNGR|nr:hypothetical protein CRG98_001420 [Punica granatum]